MAALRLRLQPQLQPRSGPGSARALGALFFIPTIREYSLRTATVRKRVCHRLLACGPLLGRRVLLSLVSGQSIPHNDYAHRFLPRSQLRIRCGGGHTHRLGREGPQHPLQESRTIKIKSAAALQTTLRRQSDLRPKSVLERESRGRTKRF